MLRRAGADLLRRGRQEYRLGLQLRFAETQPAKQDINWDEIQKFAVSDETKRELAGLRSIFNEQREYRLNEPKKITIDWDRYKDKVDPETLKVFREASESIKKPEYDPSKDIADLKAAFEPLHKQAEELRADSEKRIKELEAELKQIQGEREKLSKLTVHEALAENPEIAKEIDREISEGNFLP